MSSRRHELALALIKQGGLVAASHPVQTVHAPEATYLDTQRLTIASPTPGTTKSQSVQMPGMGRLQGLEIFVDTPGTGDYISATLRDRVLFSSLYVDLAVKASYEKKLDEAVQTGDLLTLAYHSMDSTSKTVTWTPTFARY